MKMKKKATRQINPAMYESRDSYGAHLTDIIIHSKEGLTKNPASKQNKPVP